MSRVNTPLGRRLRAERGRHGLSQDELALRAGVSPASVSGLETGRVKDPIPRTLVRIADAMGLDAGELLDLAAMPTKATAQDSEPASIHAGTDNARLAKGRGANPRRGSGAAPRPSNGSPAAEQGETPDKAIEAA